MILSKYQYNQILPAVDEINLSITNFKKGLGVAGQRLEALHKAGFHIECLIINGQLIENSIKMILRSHYLRRQILKALNLPDFSVGVDLGDYQEQTLGFLIKKLKLFTGQSPLIVKLWNFKNQYRDEFIHRIFGGGKDIGQIDIEADNFLRTEEFRGIILELSEINLQLKAEIESLY